ncbi:unnamed protein product [Diatraea saccharalis]|uniref:Uncharacterized protein n=1 Tax=Diatraea saccharalis TaxID=40085 RepID=A0A9N9QXG3_9NEOP|nr:unnamed protein product [Diatraea saccharalis]
MSSESSVSFSASSRIRQFGLYRTIDARTEEFLKQSRKRQVKQGCVCATISTAITVTVVITVFLVYVETGINRDSSKQPITKSNWIGLINDSTSSSFDEKFSKSKLNFDRATIKLLPLLIKALKQNRFLEKIIEDYSSPSPVYERRVTTESILKKNIFINKNSWMKKPTSRLYAIEYKTSPILFTYNNANTKLAYFTKIRKIRDYNRIMQYFEKSNTDKDNDHTLSMYSDDYNSVTKKTLNSKVDSPLKTVKTYSNQPSSKRLKPLQIISNSKNNKNEIVGCKCEPSQLSMLLNKILSSLQTFLPGFKLNLEQKISTNSTPNKTKRINTKLIEKKKTTLPLHLSEFDNIFQVQDKISSIEFKSKLRKENLTTEIIDRDCGANINFKSDMNATDEKETPSTLTTVKQSAEPTEYKKPLFLTQPISTSPTSVLDILQTKNLITTTRKYVSQYSKKNIGKINSQHSNKYPIVKPTLNQEMKPFFNSYYPTITEKINYLDASSIELFKSKILPSRYHSNLKTFTVGPRLRNYHLPTINKTTQPPPKLFLHETTYKFNKTSVVSNLRIGENVTEKKELINSTPFIAQEDYKHESQSNESLYFYYQAYTPSTKRTNVKSTLNGKKNRYNFNIHTSKTEEIESTNDNDYQEENYFKPTESMTSLPLTVINNTVVILLIYEYAVAIESSLVQVKRKAIRRANINVTNDNPVADRLDRSYFGFDQDYYERMPLLVNAMQENTYVDSTVEIVPEEKQSNLFLRKLKPGPKISKDLFKPYQLRRTSPRPFIFEYKSPTPVPFSRTYGSKSWIESYRNAQRLQNIQQVIKYLEKTINAKIGDMYTVPTNKQIAFTGVYIEPKNNNKTPLSGTGEADLNIVGENSERVDIYKSNHKSDPLFKYKPDNPGEVNLLADSFLRFSPTFFESENYKLPIFRPIPDQKKRCIGNSCENIDHSKIGTQTGLSEKLIPDSSIFSKPKSFSVMLNLFPIKSDVKNENTKNKDKLRPNSDKIYISTSKPLIFFKKKTRIPVGRRTIPVKRPRLLSQNKVSSHNAEHESDLPMINHKPLSSSMIVQINLYTPEKSSETTTEMSNLKYFFNNSQSTTTTTHANHFVPISPYTTEIPIYLSTTQVEDFHVGSSGIVPIEARTLPPPPPLLLPATTTTTVPSIFDVTLSSTEGAWYTKPPDILKFSHEDARISDEYRIYRESEYQDNKVLNRRNSRDKIDFHDIEQQTILTILENDNITTTAETVIEKDDSRLNETITTTTQINGHYRNMYRYSKILNTLLDPNSEINRKRRLSLLAKGFRRPDFSLSYTEIKRSKT